VYAKLLKSSVISLVTLLSTTSAQAERVQYAFTANNARVFSFGNGSLDPETIAGGLRNGDAVHGTFSFDTEAVPDLDQQSADISQGLYRQNISMNVVFNRTGYSLGSDSASISKVDAHSTQTWTYADIFRVEGPAQVLLTRYDGKAFSDTKLPTSLDLSSFDAARFYYDYYSPTEFANVAFSADISSLTRISAVPEPATYGMFGLGLGVLGLALRRRSRHYGARAA